MYEQLKTNNLKRGDELMPVSRNEVAYSRSMECEALYVNPDFGKPT